MSIIVLILCVCMVSATLPSDLVVDDCEYINLDATFIGCDKGSCGVTFSANFTFDANCYKSHYFKHDSEEGDDIIIVIRDHKQLHLLEKLKQTSDPLVLPTFESSDTFPIITGSDLVKWGIHVDHLTLTDVYNSTLLVDSVTVDIYLDEELVSTTMLRMNIDDHGDGISTVFYGEHEHPDGTHEAVLFRNDTSIMMLCASFNGLLEDDETKPGLLDIVNGVVQPIPEETMDAMRIDGYSNPKTAYVSRITEYLAGNVRPRVTDDIMFWYLPRKVSTCNSTVGTVDSGKNFKINNTIVQLVTLGSVGTPVVASGLTWVNSTMYKDDATILLVDGETCILGSGAYSTISWMFTEYIAGLDHIYGDDVVLIGSLRTISDNGVSINITWLDEMAAGFGAQPCVIDLVLNGSTYFTCSFNAVAFDDNSAIMFRWDIVAPFPEGTYIWIYSTKIMFNHKVSIDIPAYYSGLKFVYGYPGCDSYGYELIDGKLGEKNLVVQFDERLRARDVVDVSGTFNLMANILKSESVCPVMQIPSVVKDVDNRKIIVGVPISSECGSGAVIITAASYPSSEFTMTKACSANISIVPVTCEVIGTFADGVETLRLTLTACSSSNCISRDLDLATGLISRDHCTLFNEWGWGMSDAPCWSRWFILIAVILGFWLFAFIVMKTVLCFHYGVSYTYETTKDFCYKLAYYATCGCFRRMRSKRDDADIEQSPTKKKRRNVVKYPKGSEAFVPVMIIGLICLSSVEAVCDSTVLTATNVTRCVGRDCDVMLTLAGVLPMAPGSGSCFNITYGSGGSSIGAYLTVVGVNSKFPLTELYKTGDPALGYSVGAECPGPGQKSGCKSTEMLGAKCSSPDGSCLYSGRSGTNSGGGCWLVGQDCRYCFVTWLYGAPSCVVYKVGFGSTRQLSVNTTIDGVTYLGDFDLNRVITKQQTYGSLSIIGTYEDTNKPATPPYILDCGSRAYGIDTVHPKGSPGKLTTIGWAQYYQNSWHYDSFEVQRNSKLEATKCHDGGGKVTLTNYLSTRSSTLDIYDLRSELSRYGTYSMTSNSLSVIASSGPAIAYQLVTKEGAVTISVDIACPVITSMEPIGTLYRSTEVNKATVKAYSSCGPGLVDVTLYQGSEVQYTTQLVLNDRVSEFSLPIRSNDLTSEYILVLCPDVIGTCVNTTVTLNFKEPVFSVTSEEGIKGSNGSNDRDTCWYCVWDGSWTPLSWLSGWFNWVFYVILAAVIVFVVVLCYYGIRMLRGRKAKKSR